MAALVSKLAGNRNQQYVLHEDELTDTPIAVFEVEQQAIGNAANGKAQVTETNRTVDVFIGQDKEILSFEGYHAPVGKRLLFYVLGILTGGLVFLLAKWAPKLRILLSLSRCQLRDAEYVRITLVDGRVDLEPVTLIKHYDGSSGLPPLQTDGAHSAASLLDQSHVQRLLEYRCHRYFFIPSLETFVPVPDVPRGFAEQLQRAAFEVTGGAADAAAVGKELGSAIADRQMRYGANEMRIPVKSVGLLVFDEMWHPFYVFQYFSVLIWCAGDQYYTYAVCIMLITWFSIITSAMETNSNARRLAGIAYYSCMVDVLRGGEWRKVASTELVSGDLVAVDACVLPCDMVLLRGECIVDENMLTGESVPVRKVVYSPVADGLGYHPDRSAACTLYGGTSVAQAKAPRGQKPVAMVCRTRFYSAKGQLLRSILFPREHSESFVSDSLKFIFVMLVACIALFIWAAVVLATVGAEPTRIVLRFFDMITIAVPPALPACLTIATVFSIGRLRLRGIFVTGPDTITVSGQLDVICFDKTGTLTEQGLELQGIVPISPTATFEPMALLMQQLPPSIPQLLASCHGLARMGDTLVGDPLDQKLFAACAWEMHEDQEPGVLPQGQAALPTFGAVKGAEDVAAEAHSAHAWVCPPRQPHSQHHVVRRFEFSSALQRNGVVVRQPALPGGAPGGHTVFVKGSPEMIRTLVQPQTVPADFDRVLGEYTKEGFRVLALACGPLPISIPDTQLPSLTQEELEAATPLTLVGLAVMANPLRPDSAGVITQLHKANIRCAMVTGDHVRTAISVAHQAGILPEGKAVCLVDGADVSSTGPVFPLSVLYPDGSVMANVQKSVVMPQVMTGELECAITGKGFGRLLDTLDEEVLQPVLRRASVFARMSPDHKRDLMGLLGSGLDSLPTWPKLGLHVGFCGDGANDCGALKAAHVGVSLCEAEASVAAPMTSRQQTIASMVTVVSEGRCALMATYQIFQFIVGYAMAQAFSTNLMYTYALQMGNYQYLIQDLFFITILAALMGYTRPREELARSKPVGRVLSLPLLLSTVLQLMVVIGFQVAALQLLRAAPGYTPTLGTPDLRTIVAPETTIIYVVGLSQFVILALVFNKGYPHRQELWTNAGLSVAIVLQICFIVYTLFSVDRFTVVVEQLVDKEGPVTNTLRGWLLLLMVANAVVAVGAEALSGVLLGWITRVQDKRRGRDLGMGVTDPGYSTDSANSSTASQSGVALLAPLGRGPGAAGKGVSRSSLELLARPGNSAAMQQQHVVLGGAGALPAGLHVPRMQAPGSAELL